MFARGLGTSHLPLLQYYYAIPSRFGRLTLPSLYSFCIYGRIWLLSPLDIFVLALLKRFESLANDGDSLFAFIFISTGLSAAIR